MSTDRGRGALMNGCREMALGFHVTSVLATERSMKPDRRHFLFSVVFFFSSISISI